MLRKLGMLGAAVLAVVTGMLVQPAGVSPAGAEPAPASKSCTIDGVTWRVDYTTWPDSAYGPLMKADGMKRIQGGVEIDATQMIWEWRRDLPPSSHGTWDSWKSRFNRGPLQPRPPGDDHAHEWYGVEWQSEIFSPRVVSPGGCQIYFAPFVNIGGSPTWPRVAVLGDSLLGSLNDSTVNQNNIQGYVEAVLNEDQTLAEVEGQGGRRWTMTLAETHEDGTPLTPLEKADSYMLDEYRALLEHNLEGVVVGLGANDALGLTFTPAEQRDAARAEVHDRLIDVLAEMTAGTDCLVAVTAPEHPNSFFGAGPVYGQEATTINNILRWIAASNGNDNLHLVEFGLQAKDHQYNPANPNDPNSWFGEDNLHLNAAGRLVYTDRMRQAARICTGFGS